MCSIVDLQLFPNSVQLLLCIFFSPLGIKSAWFRIPCLSSKLVSRPPPPPIRARKTRRVIALLKDSTDCKLKVVPNSNTSEPGAVRLSWAGILLPDKATFITSIYWRCLLQYVLMLCCKRVFITCALYNVPHVTRSWTGFCCIWTQTSVCCSSSVSVAT